MEFIKSPELGKRFAFPENFEITINGDTFSTANQVAIRIAERYEDAVIQEIVKEAHAAGYTEVTVLNKAVLIEALDRYFRPPVTNADRIRAMSDEELAEVIMCPYGSEPDICCTKGTCLECCEEWLKQPAEVD